MPIRINTTDASATSGAFSPTNDFSVQAEFEPGSTAYIDIEGQVDGAATPASPWVALASLSINDFPPIKRFARCPNVRLRLYNNNGKAAKAWSAE